MVKSKCRHRNWPHGPTISPSGTCGEAEIWRQGHPSPSWRGCGDPRTRIALLRQMPRKPGGRGVGMRAESVMSNSLSTCSHEAQGVGHALADDKLS